MVRTREGTILVVEDDADTRDLLQWILQQEGFEVVTAENGAVALRSLESTKPDLILTDLMMPLVTGEVLIKTLKKRQGCGDTPIIVLTAFSDAFGEEARAAGATAVLRKPRDIPQVAQTVNRLLGRPEGD